MTRNRTYGLIAGLFLWCAASSLYAQEFYVDSIQPTIINTAQAQLDAYVLAGWTFNSEMNTATTSPSKAIPIFHQIDMGAGLSTSIYSSKFDYLRFICSLGYKYNRSVYSGDYFSNSGIHTHWLTSEWKLGLFFDFCGLDAGIAVDGLLKQSVVPDFRYLGFHEDCINKLSVKGVFDLYLPLRYCTFGFRIGLDIIPQVNLQKLAYYNLAHSEINILSYEVRLYIPIFTTFANHTSAKKYIQP